MKTKLESLTILIFMVLSCSPSSRSPNKTQTLTSEHRSAIAQSLSAKGYPAPVSLEINDSGFLVATFELNGNGPQQFAEARLLAIREAMLPFHVVESYRVTVNGPSPGTGLIRRYGSMRFSELDGGMNWEPAR